MNQTDFDALLNDTTKRIVGDISWTEDEDHSPTVEFRVEVESDAGYPIFIRGSYNSLAGALSYTVVHRGSGRIYALDLGKDHHNPVAQMSARNTNTGGTNWCVTKMPTSRMTLLRR